MAKLKHIVIATQNPEGTASFYKDVFELESIGRIESEDAEGYYLSDGNVNLAILRYKNDTAAGEELGTEFSGIHHIGFQVEDMEATDFKLRKANSIPREKINDSLKAGKKKGRGGRNVELKYTGPDGALIDISRDGWVGTNGL